MKILGLYIFTRSNFAIPNLRDRILEFVENYDQIKEMNRLNTNKDMVEYLENMIKDLKK